MTRREFIELAHQYGLHAKRLDGTRFRVWNERSHICVTAELKAGTGWYAAYGTAPFPHPISGVLVPRYHLESPGLRYSDLSEPMTAVNGSLPVATPTDQYGIAAMRRFRVLQLYSLTNGRCVYCEKPFKIRDMTADHITPLVRLGLDQPENITIACKPCNERKADMTVEEYRQMLRVPSFPLLEMLTNDRT